MLPRRIFAIDWSGAKKFGKKIVLANVDEKGLRELKDDWKSRDEVADYLIEKANEDEKLVVGFDFAFSFPQWFLQEKGCLTAIDFWELVQEEGEKWLTYPPFFTKGRWNSPNSQFRKIEEDIKQRTSNNPETVFKLIGPKQVGKSSVTGMPILAKLRKNGFNIWPFDLPKLPMAVEIYPRLFYSTDINKSDLKQRYNYLEKYPYSSMSKFHRIKAVSSDDAFDAVVSALEMFSKRKEFVSFSSEKNDVAKIEGQIWCPSNNS